jgi:hypothetical protein
VTSVTEVVTNTRVLYSVSERTSYACASATGAHLILLLIRSEPPLQSLHAVVGDYAPPHAAPIRRR